MRILFLAPQPFFVERGTPIAVRLAVTALCKAGHDVDLVTLHEGEDIALERLRLVRIRRPPFVMKVPIGLSIQKLICDIWLAATAYRLLYKHRYDVVHAVEEAVFPALAARIFSRFKLVYDADSIMSDQLVEKWPIMAWARPALGWFERVAVKNSDLVLAVCPAIGERMSRFAKPGIVHLTPDVAFSSSEALPEGGVDDLRSLFGVEAPLALYVGNLERYQGVDLLLEGLAAVPPADRCHLVVIGGSAEAIIGYRETAVRLGISERAHFAGPRQLAHLPAYLAQADILCSPRMGGVNTPMKIYSYMAAGRAILATKVTSHTQVLDGSCALLVDPTPTAVGEGLRTLAAAPEMRSMLGRNAKARAADVYSVTAFEGRLMDAYGSLQLAAPATE